MSTKRDLNAALASNQSAPPPMVRGKGYGVSTNDLDAQIEPIAPIEPPAATIQRNNAKIDAELIRDYRLLALKQGRKLYEVMEDALREYLQKL
jgi:hypothetical protein